MNTSGLEMAVVTIRENERFIANLMVIWPRGRESSRLHIDQTIFVFPLKPRSSIYNMQTSPSCRNKRTSTGRFPGKKEF